MRTLPECRQTVVKHIVEANPSMEFHFYVYLTVDTEAEVLGAQQLVSQAYPNVKSVLVLNGKQTSKCRNRRQRKGKASNRKERQGREGKGKAKAMLKQKP